MGFRFTGFWLGVQCSGKARIELPLHILKVLRRSARDSKKAEAAKFNLILEPYRPCNSNSSSN